MNEKGNQWVRTHDFMILTTFHSNFIDLDLLRATGINHAWASGDREYPDGSPSAMKQLNLAYHLRQNALSGIRLQDLKPKLANEASKNSHLVAYCVQDSPPSEDNSGLWLMRHMAEYAQRNYPALLSYSLLEGLASVDGYERFVNDYLVIVKPDILMYNDYMNWNNHPLPLRLLDLFLHCLRIIREAALKYNVPYIGWVRSSDLDWKDDPRDPHNPKGKTWLRLHVFCLLTTGHKGIGFFDYDHTERDAYGFVYGPSDGPHRRSKLYGSLVEMNHEVANLVKCLKHLTSIGVYYVFEDGFQPQEDNGFYKVTIPHWAFNDDKPHFGIGQFHIHVPAGSTAGHNHGLIGFFMDPEGEVYFMLTNLNYKTGRWEDDALHFSVLVNQPLLEWTAQGNVEPVGMPTPNQLDVRIRGGSGKLYKFQTGSSFYGTGT